MRMSHDEKMNIKAATLLDKKASCHYNKSSVLQPYRPEKHIPRGEKKAFVLAKKILDKGVPRLYNDIRIILRGLYL